MAKTFKQEDLYESDIYGDLRQSLERADAVAVKADKDFTKFHNTLTEMSQALGNSAKDVRELTEANRKSKTVLTEKQKINDQRVKIEKQLKEVTKAERIALAEVRIEQQKVNKEAKEAAKVNKGLTTEYQKQSKQLNDLRNKYKNLVLAEGKTSKASKVLLRDITKLDKRLKSVDKTVGQSQRNVGNYGESIGKLKGILGGLGLALGGFAIIRDIFNINKEFEASLASLSAITGVTGDAFVAFKQGVLDVATETKKSATEVAQAFEIVGSAKPELLADADALAEVTKQAILLSQATRLDLEVSARSLTGTMNQFGLSAEEASRVINVLAAGSQAGAAPVDKISESLDKFGTIANSINVSVEESVALIEVLAEKSITGAEAGTQLRNVLTKLATIETLPDKALVQLEKYGVNTAFVADTSNTLEDRLRELSKVQGDVNALTAIFGAQNLVAGQTLLQNVDGVVKYTDAVTGTNTATEQAAINQSTFSAIIDQLKSAWESAVLKFSESTGTFNGLKAILRFVADNLEAILVVVGKSLIVFGVYKTAIGAATLANNLFGKSVVKNVKSFGIWGAAIAAVVFVLIEVADSLFNTAKAGDVLIKVTDKVNEKMVEEEIQLKRTFTALKNTEKGTRERQEALDETNEKYGLTLENLEDEAAFVEQLAGAYQDLVEQLRKRITAQVIEEEILSLTKAIRGFEKEVEEVGGADTFLGGLITEGEGGLTFLRGELALLEQELINLESQDIKVPIGLEVEPEVATTTTGKEGKKDKKKTQAELNKQAFDDIRKQNAENLKILENEAIKDGKSQEEIDKILKDQKLRNLRIENDAALRIFGEFSLQFLDANLALNKALNVQDEEANEEQKDNRAKLFQDIQDQNKENLSILENELIKSGKSREEIDKILEDQRLENLQNERDEALRIFGENHPKFLAADLALNNALLKQREDADKKNLERLKKNVDALNKLIQDSAQIFIDSIDRKIEAGQKELQARETEAQRLEGLQERGVEGAAEALVAEKQQLAKEKGEIEDLEKKKRNLLIILTGLERANQLIQAGDGAPFKNAGQGLSDFISGLPQFRDGTNTTVGDAIGQPHLNTPDDRYLARLNKGEMVLKEGYVNQLQSAGYKTTADVTRAALLNDSRITNPYRLSDVNNDARVVDRLDRVEDAIKNFKPVKVVQQHIDLIAGTEVIRDGNKVTKNTVKKPGLRFG